MACPRSYSYAYDDATSTFTCTAADYIITFCPSLPSGKSGKDLTKPTNGSKSGPLEGFLSNSSLYADLATSDSSAIISPSSTLIFIIFVNILMLLVLLL
ncbi:putative Thaumatin family [Helianthus anomalus]